MEAHKPGAPIGHRRLPGAAAMHISAQIVGYRDHVEQIACATSHVQSAPLLAQRDIQQMEVGYLAQLYFVLTCFIGAQQILSPGSGVFVESADGDSGFWHGILGIEVGRW